VLALVVDSANRTIFTDSGFGKSSNNSNPPLLSARCTASPNEFTVALILADLASLSDAAKHWAYGTLLVELFA
jgi:hypothetical protein